MSKYTRNTKLDLSKRFLAGETSSKLSSFTSIPARQIRYRAQVYRLNNEQSFIKRPKPYSSMEKYHILLKMMTERWSLGYTSAFYNLASPGILSTWYKRFITYGLSGLNSKQGKASMNTKNNPSKEPNDSDLSLRELKAELDYLRAENAYLKKLDALLKEQECQTPEKQGSSNS